MIELTRPGSLVAMDRHGRVEVRVYLSASRNLLVYGDLVEVRPVIYGIEHVIWDAYWAHRVV